VIVIDASALLEVLLNTPASGKVAERLFAGNDTLHAPHLIDLEVAQVLRRYTHFGEWTRSGASKRSKISLTWQ
jgi:predicted nucleic acid-binding protein